MIVPTTYLAEMSIRTEIVFSRVPHNFTLFTMPDTASYSEGQRMVKGAGEVILIIKASVIMIFLLESSENPSVFVC